MAKIEEVLLISFPKNAANPPEAAFPEIDPELATLMPGFLAEVVESSRSLRSAAADNDFLSAAEIAHQVAGMGGSYGFNRITEVARVAEQAAAAGDKKALIHSSDELAAYVDALRREFES